VEGGLVDCGVIRQQQLWRVAIGLDLRRQLFFLSEIIPGGFSVHSALGPLSLKSGLHSVMLFQGIVEHMFDNSLINLQLKNIINR
jgi:hypothetical protein